MATIEKQPDGPLAMMIDIETLGLGSDVFVTQIGLCIADTVKREYILSPTNIWLTKQGQADRRIDFDTVRWWMKQDPKVQASVFGDHIRNSSAEAYSHVKRWVDGYPDMTIWGSPAMFDLPCLSSLWEGKPWKYNMERDMMTLYKLLDPKGELQPPNNDMGHDAAADAQWQMEYLFNLLDRLRVLQAERDWRAPA
jgi:hypothetical protein